MNNIIYANIKNAFLWLSISLIVIFAAEKLEIAFIIKYILKIFLLIYFLTSVYLSKDVFTNVKNKYLRFLLIILLCFLMTTIFGFISFVVMVNFDLAIGGHL